MQSKGRIILALLWSLAMVIGESSASSSGHFIPSVPRTEGFDVTTCN